MRVLAVTTWAALLFAAANAAANERAALPSDTAIRDILPHGEAAEEICFAGEFAGKRIDVEDWAHTRIEVLPNVIVGGKPATRPVPRELPDREISHMALRLAYHDRTEDGAFDYLFTLMVASEDLPDEVYARSGCGWGWPEDSNDHPEAKLACWIECDGGGFTAERVAGTKSIDLTFDYLSMQAGCEGRGSYRIGTTERSKRTSFRLKAVARDVCKPLEDWGAGQ